MLFLFFSNLICCNNNVLSFFYTKHQSNKQKFLTDKQKNSKRVRYYNQISVKNCLFNYLGKNCILGGAIYIKNRNSNNIIKNCTFQKCFAQYGGSIYIFTSKNSNTTFYNCDFQDNYARKKGGAIFASNSNIFFQKCNFFENRVYYDKEKQENVYNYLNGGAIMSYYSTEKFDECIFTDNLAVYGEDIYFLYKSNRFKLSINNCLFERKKDKKYASGILIFIDGHQLKSEYTLNFTNNEVILLDSFQFTLFGSFFNQQNKIDCNIANNSAFPYKNNIFKNICNDLCRTNTCFNQEFHKSSFLVNGNDIIDSTSNNKYKRNYLINSFVKRKLITQSYQFTPSNSFSQSDGFTQINTFPKSYLIQSYTFSPSCPFTPSYSFTPGTTFTPSTIFTPSNFISKNTTFWNKPPYSKSQSSIFIIPSNIETNEVTKSTSIKLSDKPTAKKELFNKTSSIIIIISCIIIIDLCAIFIVIMFIKMNGANNAEYLNDDDSSIRQNTEDLNFGL